METILKSIPKTTKKNLKMKHLTEILTYDIVSMNCSIEENGTEINVYPNPTNGEFTIDFTTTVNAGEGEISFADSKGMVLFVENMKIVDGHTIFPMTLKGLSPGIYFVYVTVNGESTIERVSMH